MIAILNRAAGGPTANSDESDRQVRELFTNHGIELRILHPEGERDLAELAAEAARDTGDVIVAGGGDGTISAVASALVGTGKALGVLPLGTLNHFAKDLGIPLELDAAVETIARGHAVAVDTGEVNGRLFLNNSSLGLYPRIVANREAQQERLARGKWTAFGWAALRALRRFPFLDLSVALPGEKLHRRTAFLFVGNNEYEFSGFNLGSRRCINAGRLGLYLTHRTGRLGLLRLALRALIGRLAQADDFDVFCAEQATIESRHARLLVATDGEVNWMETPLDYRIRPAALRVLVPQPTTSE
ncbi:MAG: diacylglycerol/lipid kinase family protein [Chthoniobacterales bacterium]